MIELRTPCATCPYRRSVRLAFWSIREYKNLIANDTLLGGLFACHGERKKAGHDRRLCAGWLLDQKRRDVPNMLLRVQLYNNPKLMQHFNRIRDLGKKLYGSIAEMFEANYPGGRRRPMQPKPKPTTARPRRSVR